MQLVFAPPQLSDLASAIESWRQNAGEDEGGMLFIASPPPNGQVRQNLANCEVKSSRYTQPALVFIPFYNGPVEEGKEKFKALYNVGPVADMTQEMPYEVINSIQVFVVPMIDSLR